MRAPPDRLRRRTPLLRKRADLLAPGPHTNSQDNRPDIGQNIAYKANRQGVAERVNDPAVQQTIAVDLARLTYYAELRRDLARSRLKPATQHEAQTRSVLQTVPGLGTILRLVLLYEIHALGRFPRGQDLASYARLVKCSNASAGNRLGPSGKNIGHAHLPWAFSEAATLFLRTKPNGETLLTRVAKKHGQGNALTIRAHQRARAVYDRLKRQTAFELAIFLRASRRRVGEPAVYLDTHGMSRHRARCISCSAASWNTQAGIGPVSQRPGG